MENKLVPKLRFPGFEGEWEIKLLSNLSSKIGSGKTPLGGDKVYSNFGIPFIRSQNVTGDNLLLDQVHITHEVHNSMKSSKVLPNDILLNITGASIGRSCVVPHTIIEANVNQHVCIIRLKTDNAIFIQKILSSKIGQKLIYQTQTGSGREGLNFDSINKFKLNLPSLPEQQKIADYLSTIDKKITLLEEKKEELSRYKKAMMQKLFSQEIRFKPDGSLLFDKLRVTAPDDCSAELVNCHLFDKLRVTTTPVEADEQRVTTKPDDCPAELVDCHLFDKLRETAQDDCPAELVEAHNHTVTSNAVDLYPDWEGKRLGDITTRIRTKNKDNNQNILTISGQKGLINQFEYYNNQYAAKDVSNYYLIEKDDFAYNKSYSKGYPYGAIKRLKKFDYGVLSTLYICFRFKEVYNNSYFEHYFESGVFNRNLYKICVEGARNHGLLNVSIDDFFNEKIFIPSLPEQQKIADFLSAIDSSIDKVKEQIEQTQAFKKAMLQQMFV
jgi:restriction endonuclease S subunit